MDTRGPRDLEVSATNTNVCVENDFVLPRAIQGQDSTCSKRWPGRLGDAPIALAPQVRGAVWRAN